jgi:hypothetical protein
VTEPTTLRVIRGPMSILSEMQNAKLRAWLGRGAIAGVLTFAAAFGAPGGVEVVSARLPSSRASVASVRQILLRRNGLDNQIPFGAADGYVGWEENSRRYPYHYDVVVADPTGTIRYINAPGTDGEAGGIDGTTIVYSEFGTTSVHLKLYDLTTGIRTDIPQLDTAAPDYHPTISGPWILFTRGDRGRTTRVLLFNRISGALRQLTTITPHRTRAFVYSGQVAGNYAVWGRVTKQGQDIFRYRIDTRVNRLLRRPRGLFARYDPAVTPAGTAYWEQTSNACRPTLQIVAQKPGGRARIIETIHAGNDGGYMYAEAGSGKTDLLYSRFTYRGCEVTQSSQSPGALYDILVPR